MTGCPIRPDAVLTDTGPAPVLTAGPPALRCSRTASGLIAQRMPRPGSPYLQEPGAPDADPTVIISLV